MYSFVFLERWNIDAPIAAVFENLSNINRYAIWGAPAYLKSSGEAPVVGARGSVVLRGALPYQLSLECTLAELVFPHRIVIDACGDLVGRQVLTLKPTEAGGTSIESDWRANTRWWPLSLLAPVLRPLFRWNHHWCTRVAYAGLAKHLGKSGAPAALEREAELLND